jgi:O-methyltransferase
MMTAMMRIGTWSSRLMQRVPASLRALSVRASAPDLLATNGHVDPLLQHASAEDRSIVERAAVYSMTGIARMLGLVDAVRYCTARQVPGAFAECGVWRGGSVMAMILTLQDLGVEDRDIYLYDTFEGMTAPSEDDVSRIDGSALLAWRAASRDQHPAWEHLFGPDAFSEETVRTSLLATGYPPDRLHFVRGPVEETLPAVSPGELALLRLDTDWYESTAHELLHLFPRLRTGGVLIIDDYGHWRGAQRAVDEYFATHHPPLMLGRLDYSGRIAVKQ